MPPNLNFANQSRKIPWLIVLKAMEIPKGPKGTHPRIPIQTLEQVIHWATKSCYLIVSPFFHCFSQSLALLSKYLLGCISFPDLRASLNISLLLPPLLLIFFSPPPWISLLFLSPFLSTPSCSADKASQGKCSPPFFQEEPVKQSHITATIQSISSVALKGQCDFYFFSFPTSWTTSQFV